MIIDRQKSCCFTGHRVIPKNLKDSVESYTVKLIIELINQGYEYFLCGGALGFDTIAAKAVLSLKYRFPHIKLVVIIPCLSQADAWKVEDVETYRSIIDRSYFSFFTSVDYHQGCMHKRNRFLVNNSSVCISYLSRKTGGTKYTVDYAIKKGLNVFNINDFITSGATIA